MRSLKLKQIIKTRSILIAGVLLLTGSRAVAQWQQFKEVSFYVSAHQDDWQLFMGTDAFNDINTFNEMAPGANGKKVVIIYTTAGNLHDDDDAKSCDCKEPYPPFNGHIPYWKVREKGAKNSIHLAACRIGGWGPATPYPQDEATVINGHKVTKYVFKNTVSYFLRIKTGPFTAWKTGTKTPAETIDNSTEYADWTDFVNTLYYIYKVETDSSMSTNVASFHFPDIDSNVNPADHHEHILAGRAACEAAKMLGANKHSCYPESLYIDYHTQNLPENLDMPDAQNEAAMMGVYSLALLDYNAWPEWGKQYQEWTGRNYFRTITSCENPTASDILAQDSLNSLNIKVYPNPADKQLTVRFNIPPASPVTTKIVNSMGATVFQYRGWLTSDTYSVNTANLPNGNYVLIVGTDSVQLSSKLIQVAH